MPTSKFKAKYNLHCLWYKSLLHQFIRCHHHSFLAYIEPYIYNLRLLQNLIPDKIAPFLNNKNSFNSSVIRGHEIQTQRSYSCHNHFLHIHTTYISLISLKGILDHIWSITLFFNIFWKQIHQTMYKRKELSFINHNHTWLLYKAIGT